MQLFKQLNIFKTLAVLPCETPLGFNVSIIQGYNVCLLIFMIPYLAPHIFFMMALLTIGACLLIGPLHSFCYRIFPTAARCRGVMIGDAASVGIFEESVVPMCLEVQHLSGSVLITSILEWLSLPCGRLEQQNWEIEK
jgi:hypothetical protein